jgi:hypothetical protein
MIRIAALEEIREGETHVIAGRRKLLQHEYLLKRG